MSKTQKPRYAARAWWRTARGSSNAYTHRPQNAIRAVCGGGGGHKVKAGGGEGGGVWGVCVREQVCVGQKGRKGGRWW